MYYLRSKRLLHIRVQYGGVVDKYIDDEIILSGKKNQIEDTKSLCSIRILGRYRTRVTRIITDEST